MESVWSAVVDNSSGFVIMLPIVGALGFAAFLRSRKLKQQLHAVSSEAQYTTHVVHDTVPLDTRFHENEGLIAEGERDVAQ